MTSKIGRCARDAGALEKFPIFPPRDDMQNSLHLHFDGHQPILRRHLGDKDSMIVLSEVPVRWSPNQVEGHRIPDLIIAFDVDSPLIIEQNGYSIREQGKPPDFVLEVASATTGRQDVVDKRHDYAAFGIPEYWRFDPTGGRRHDAPLAGDRMEGGEYQPVEIHELEPNHLHGHSDILDLDACWDHGKLRWFDRSSGQHLLTFAEEQEALVSEREAHAAEREARIAAEARVRELEEQLRTRNQH